MWFFNINQAISFTWTPTRYNIHDYTYQILTVMVEFGGYSAPDDLGRVSSIGPNPMLLDRMSRTVSWTEGVDGCIRWGNHKKEMWKQKCIKSGAKSSEKKDIEEACATFFWASSAKRLCWSWCASSCCLRAWASACACACLCSSCWRWISCRRLKNSKIFMTVPWKW